MRKSLGFTLAEVLITLAIIGVVAAMTIPSVIVNTNQQEFKTGLKKAISVLNQAITMNIALESTSPADVKTQAEFFTYLTSRLNVIKTTTEFNGGAKNQAFYTSDGMRFELPKTAPSIGGTTFALSLCGPATGAGGGFNAAGDPIGTPCAIIVDVNGDKKPNPKSPGAAYVYPSPNSDRISDLFTVMITDTAAIPLGVVAQKTMFQSD